MNRSTKRNIIYSNGEGSDSALDYMKVGSQSLSGIGNIATAFKGSATSAIKNTCGRRPWFGKSRKATWDNCNQAYVASLNYHAPVPLRQAPIVQHISPPPTKSTNKVLIYVGIGLGVLLLTGIIIAIKKK